MHQKIMLIPSLKEQVYSYLKEAIAIGELEVGSFYSVQQVASKLGVSRSPVREAVQQLQHEGIVDVYPYKGFTIKTISRSEIDEVFEVREAIECFCLRKIISQYGTDSFDALMVKMEKIIQEQKSIGLGDEPLEYWKLDKVFHRIIVDYSNNKTLKQVYESISDKISNIALATLRDKQRFVTASKEHQLILEHLKQGSPTAIEKNTVHLDNTRKLMLSSLEKASQKGMEKQGRNM